MTLKSTNKLIGSNSDKGGRKPPKRRDRYDRRGKSSTLATKAFDSIEAAIGGRDAVVGALAAGDLTEDQSYLFGLIADPRNDARSLAHICGKAHYSLGALLQLFKDAKLARAQIEAIVKVTDELPTVAADTMTLAKIRKESCRACKGTGKVATNDGVLEASCDVCHGSGSHTYTPSIERQKLALELGGLYHSRGGVQIANVFPPAANELGERITPDYLKNMRLGTDRLLYPGRSKGIDTSEAIDVELVEKPEETKSETKSESKTNTDGAVAPVPSVDPGTRTTRTSRADSDSIDSSDSPFLAPTGARPKEPA